MIKFHKTTKDLRPCQNIIILTINLGSNFPISFFGFSHPFTANDWFGNAVFEIAVTICYCSYPKILMWKKPRVICLAAWRIWFCISANVLARCVELKLPESSLNWSYMHVNLTDSMQLFTDLSNNTNYIFNITPLVGLSRT